MKFGSHTLTLRQLQYVVAVSKDLSFRRAAERCLVSQPSLSAQVAEAERALGVKLFERDRRRVLVTAAGKDVVLRATRLLLDFEDLLGAASQHLDPLLGTLRLGVIPTVGPYLLPDLDPALRAAFPELSLRWTEDKTEVLVEKVKNAELDAAVLALEADIGDLAHDLLMHDTFVLAAPAAHSLYREERLVRTSELRDESVLLLDDGHCFRDQALELCSSVGAAEMGFRATSMATLVQMVAAGNNLTLLPEMAVEVENRHGQLAIRHFAEPAPSRTLVLAWRAQSPLGDAFAKIADAGRTALQPRPVDTSASQNATHSD